MPGRCYLILTFLLLLESNMINECFTFFSVYCIYTLIQKYFHICSLCTDVRVLYIPNLSLFLFSFLLLQCRVEEVRQLIFLMVFDVELRALVQHVNTL